MIVIVGIGEAGVYFFNFISADKNLINNSSCIDNEKLTVTRPVWSLNGKVGFKYDFTTSGFNIQYFKARSDIISIGYKIVFYWDIHAGIIKLSFFNHIRIMGTYKKADIIFFFSDKVDNKPSHLLKDISFSCSLYNNRIAMNDKLQD